MKKHTTKTAPTLGPIARALLGRVAAATDVRTLYALESDTWAGALDDAMPDAELRHVLAAGVARRDALAPIVHDTRRATLEGFAAFLLAEDDGNAPTAESLAASVAWYTAGCAPGGSGLDAHRPMDKDKPLFLAPEPAPTPAPFEWGRFDGPLAPDPELSKALTVMAHADHAAGPDDLAALSEALAGSGLPDDLRAEVDATIARNSARLADAAGRAALARIMAAPDGFALAEIDRETYDTLSDVWAARRRHALNARREALAPGVVAELTRRAGAAADLGTLRRVHQDAFCLELDGPQVNSVLAAVEAARARLTPPDDGLDAIRRRAVESFAAVVSAEHEGGFIPTPDELADLIRWFVPACRPGGPGLLVHAGSYGESAHFVAAESLPTVGGAQ